MHPNWGAQRDDHDKHEADLGRPLDCLLPVLFWIAFFRPAWLAPRQPLEVTPTRGQNAVNHAGARQRNEGQPPEEQSLEPIRLDIADLAESQINQDPRIE